MLNLINTAPLLAEIADQNIPEETTLMLQPAVINNDPGDLLVYSLVTAPQGASINPATGLITWTPTEQQGPGIFDFTIRVRDNGVPALEDTASFVVHVAEVNQAPVLAAIGNKAVERGALLQFTATATDSDLPPNTLTFSLDPGAPAGASINPVSGAFQWTPGASQGPGVFSATVRVTDNGTPPLADSETIQINVTLTTSNTDPVLGDIGNQQIDEAQELTFTATATDLHAGERPEHGLPNRRHHRRGHGPIHLDPNGGPGTGQLPGERARH